MIELATPKRALSAADANRYARQMNIPSIGTTGQQNLRSARVLVIGAGGLGSPVIMYLAAAGVGTLGIVDDDVVDESNLQRQVLHSTAEIGRSKVESARDFVKRLDSRINVVEHAVRLDETNVTMLVQGYDVVVDGSDNFTTRYLVNDACVLLKKPCVWGSVYQFSGQASVFWKTHGPCYRCLFPEPPPSEYAPSCAEGGVFGAICGTIGALQAAETIKLITGVGKPLLGRMWVQDSEAAESRVVNIASDPECPACGVDPQIVTPQPVLTSCVIPAPHLPTVTVAELSQLINPDGTVPGDVEIWDIREEFEWISGTIPGADLLGATATASREPRKTTREVIIYCQGGFRSSRTLPDLLARGVHARHLDGGIEEWDRTMERIEK